MISRSLRFTAVFILISLILGIVTAGAQTPAERREPGTTRPNSASRRGDLGDELPPRKRSLTPTPPQIIDAPQATGGPDEYGYEWDDAVTHDWVNAMDLGSNTGLYGGDVFTGPVDIGFNFPFYENDYGQLYISTKGMVMFGSGDVWWENTYIPNVTQPDNFIAPFWTDLGMYTYEDTDPPVVREGAGIYTYQSLATSPKYFVVEWNQADTWSGEGAGGFGELNLTFQVILYENGDIKFQYENLEFIEFTPYTSVGIEDNLGLDGLQYYDLPVDGQAILFSRPSDSRRVRAWPLENGQFTHANKSSAFEIHITNTGSLGADTFDLHATSTWPVTFYENDGVTLLSDTNGNSFPDTGSLPEGTTETIVARVQTPSVVNLGDHNLAVVNIVSASNPAMTKSAYLRSAVPTPFAQAYSDDSDGAATLYRVRPDTQTAQKLSQDFVYPFQMAVSEGPARQLIYAWGEGECLDPSCNTYIEEVNFSVLDHAGNLIKPATTLVDHSTAITDTYDYNPAVAITPDGQIGVTWVRQLYNNANNRSNYNIYLAILDGAGNISSGPLNLTNNTGWGTSSTEDVPRFYAPSLTATGDNRFVSVWERNERTGPLVSDRVYDIYAAVHTSTGSEVVAPANLTNATPGGGPQFYDPSLTAQGSNKAFLTYTRYDPGFDEYAVLYRAFDSSGATVQGETIIGPDGDHADAVELSNGNMLVTWTSFSNLEYAVLSPSYTYVKTPTALASASVFSWDDFVSVTKDQDGHGILTWMEGDWSQRFYLYYAALNADGSVFMDPMIFQSTAENEWEDDLIFTSEIGFGNTSYSEYVTTLDVDAFIHSLSPINIPSGSPANVTLPIEFGNNGASIATQIVVTATLEAGLTYLSDNLGIPPTIDGDTLTWTIPTGLEFLGSGQFEMLVDVPADPAGTIRTVTLGITSSGPEALPEDNTETVEIISSLFIHLPLLVR